MGLGRGWVGRGGAREGAKGKMAKDTYNQIKSQIKSKSNLQV